MIGIYERNVNYFQGVSNVILLTAWWNTPPLFTSLGFHSSLAKGLQINFLVANRNFWQKNQTGSGIYTTNETIASWRSPHKDSSHLVIADVVNNPFKYNVSWGSFANKIGPILPTNTETFPVVIFFDQFQAINGSQVKEGNLSEDNFQFFHSDQARL